MTTAPLTEVRDRLSEIVDDVCSGAAAWVITRHGRPAAVIMSYDEYESLVETLNGMQVTRIVTCDPHAFNSLRNEYPEFGGRYEVVHHTQLIDRLIGACEGFLNKRGIEAPLMVVPFGKVMTELPVT